MMTESLDAYGRIGSPLPTIGTDSPDSASHTRRMAALGQLACGIAHDFNNLLQVISGYADVVQSIADSGSADLGRLSRASQAIRAATDQATELTRQLYDVSQEGGATSRPACLNTVLEDVRRMFDPWIAEGAELRIVPAPNLPMAVIDPADLTAVLLALLTNAREATPAGGRIVVRTENVLLDDRQTALLNGVPTGRYVAVSVSDTGSGMPPERVARATEPFFSTKEPRKGHGLGLALVDRLAKRAGGAMRIISTVGAGTTVKLLLPTLDGASSDASTTAG